MKVVIKERIVKKQDRVSILFEDLTYNSNYCILEFGKDDDELKEIAIKRGISLPSKDLAIFKGRYGFVDQENRNGCTLPKKEVKKALRTLTGKAIDKDHLRKNTIGFWLDSMLDGEEIISYGAFWKSNFPEDYGEILTRMKEGKLKISFEAWGDRLLRDDGSYDLTNIEFAGGALLFETEPAFPDAEVIELSNKDKVLEFAKVLEDGLIIDKEIVKKESPPAKEPVVIEKEGKINKETLGGIEVDELLKKYSKTSIDELIKFIDDQMASVAIKTQELAAKDEELTSLKKSSEDAKIEIENAKIELEKVQVEAKAVKEQLDARLTAEKEAFVKTRKEELGEEYARDMTDEDICNDLKFENAKLKKELALAKTQQEKGSGKTGMEAGAQIKEKNAPVYQTQANIQAKAFEQLDKNQE